MVPILKINHSRNLNNLQNICYTNSSSTMDYIQPVPSYEINESELETDLILDDDSDLTPEEKCDYFLFSSLPEFNFTIYASLITFFWGGFPYLREAKACFLKIIQATPISFFLEIIQINELIEMLQTEINPIHAAIVLYIKPIFNEKIYNIDEIIEQAMNCQDGHVIIRMLTAYLQVYLPDLKYESCKLLTEVQEPPLLYRNAVRELFYQAGQYIPQLLIEVIDLEEQNSTTFE